MSTIAPSFAAARTRSAERRFHVGFSVALLLTALVGFARSFFLRPLFPDWPAPAEPIFYLHGAVFTAWLVLLLAQALLISSGRTRTHRRLGVAGGVLAAAMVILGATAAIVAARRPTGFIGIPVPPLQFLVIPIADVVLFGTFAGLGVAMRRTPQAHKRWMLLASIQIITAAIARWPGVIGQSPLIFFAMTDLFVVAMVVWDRWGQGRLHPVTLWGGLATVASQPLRLALSGTGAWLAIAHWLTAM